jgi:hypothetical protein
MKWIRGNLVMWDSHRKRVLDAWGPTVNKYITRFTDGQLGAATIDPYGWTTTVVEAGTGDTEFVPLDIQGGGGKITTAAAENDGGNYQLLGESFKFTNNVDIYFGTKLQIDDATQSDLLAGLCITNTDLLGGMTDGVYFKKLDGGTGVSFVLEKNTTETQTDNLHTAVNDTDMTLEFYWNGSTMEAFINGVSVVTPAVTNLPDDEELRVSIQFLAGAAAAKNCTVKWIRAIQIGV